MLSEDYVINLWNLGLSRIGVCREFMQRNNHLAKYDSDFKEISFMEAMAYIEPIIFNYEKERMRCI